MEWMLRRTGTNLKALGEAAVAQEIKSFMVNESLKNVTGQFLIAGVRSRTCHIYAVSDNNLTPHEQPGFTAVGSGSLLACSALAVAGAHKKLPVEEAICLAYEAKKLAEGAYGVGKKTDMGIVGVGIEARLFPDETIDGLDQVHLSRRALNRADKNTIRRLIGA
jgi:20S proteasome alpha/beta subunit